LKQDLVGVIGAGTMGAGISQVAAAAGHRVLLFDAQAGAAQAGRAKTGKGLDALVARGKISAADADALMSRIEIAENLESFAAAALVIEVVVEDLAVKQEIFAKLEAVVSSQAVLASNTSSISITSIARRCAHPERVVGMHFFNPAPVMKLVEIVSGVATAPSVADELYATALAWGKVPVHAKSTPGFIVNRVARRFYGEALRLLEEQVADPATLDALLTEGGGFRMGPFELMDLIGHDINYAVSLSVFNAYYQEPRFRPSLTQLELVNAGRLGRKSGRGFYDYSADATKPAPKTEARKPGSVALPDFKPGQPATIQGVRLAPTDGRTARELSLVLRMPVLLYDLARSERASRTGFACSPDVSDAFVDQFVASLHELGSSAVRLPDWPGLVVMRTVAMLANEAFEAVLLGVSNEAGVEAAMRFGVNYPLGPIEWARQIGLDRVLEVMDHLHHLTGDPRYRASLGLRMAIPSMENR